MMSETTPSNKYHIKNAGTVTPSDHMSTVEDIFENVDTNFENTQRTIEYQGGTVEKVDEQRETVSSEGVTVSEKENYFTETVEEDLESETLKSCKRYASRYQYHCNNRWLNG